MSVHEARTFRSRGGIALRIPDGLRIESGETFEIEDGGDGLTVRRLADRRRTLRKLRDLLPALEAIGRSHV